MADQAMTDQDMPWRTRPRPRLLDLASDLESWTWPLTSNPGPGLGSRTRIWTSDPGLGSGPRIPDSGLRNLEVWDPSFKVSFL